MTHRAETIMAALTTAVTGLTTTGTRVHRGRVDNVPTLPALSVFMGAERAEPPVQSFSRVRRELDVHIEIHARGNQQLETTLNAIRAEVYAALMADVTQGLGFVITTEWRADDAPELSPEQDYPIARQVMTWAVIYQHSLTSAEA